jgi:hypothetical protein
MIKIYEQDDEQEPDAEKEKLMIREHPISDLTINVSGCPEIGPPQPAGDQEGLTGITIFIIRMPIWRSPYKYGNNVLWNLNGIYSKKEKTFESMALPSLKQ